MSDQWLEAFVIVDGDGKAVGTIQDDDAVNNPDPATLIQKPDANFRTVASS